MSQFFERRREAHEDEFDDGGELDEDEDEDEDVEDEGEASAKQELSPSKLLVRAREALWEIKEIETSEGVDSFFKNYYEVLDRKGDDGTLLHEIVKIVKSPKAKAANLEIIVKRLLNKYPTLLQDEDKGQNALYLAISEKQWRLVEYMLQGCLDKSTVAEAIASPCRNGDKKTCLHLAFERNLHPRITKMLLDRAEDKALEATDMAGKTPLHYAVRYSQCSDERTELISRFIQRDQRAIAKQREENPQQPIKTFLDSMVKGSVYREHESTLKTYLDVLNSREKAIDAAEPKKRAERQERGEAAEPSAKQGSTALSINPKDRAKQSDPKHQAKYEAESTDGALGREGKQRRPGESEADGQKTSLGKKPGAYGAKLRDNLDRTSVIPRERESEANEVQQKEGQKTQEASGDTAAERSLPNSSLKRSSTARLDGADAAKKSAVKKRSDKPSPKTLARNSERILLDLKLHYLRTRTTESAISFLYGKNPDDKQVCFDYNLLPLQIKSETFRKTFGEKKTERLKFDEVLQFVSFPQVSVKVGGRQGAQNPPGPLGRRDMKFFFDWLHEKGVRHIIKVSIDDTGSIAHSEEAITSCLENFTVEHLDWQKADLDPYIICGVGSKAIQRTLATEGADSAKPVVNPLRELTLRWSGNNAILRAWSEREGLCLLPKLETIHLSIPVETCDSETWIRERVEDFKARLNQHIDAQKSSKLVLPMLTALNDSSSQAGYNSLDTASDSLAKTYVEVYSVVEGNHKEKKVTSNEHLPSGPMAPQDITSHQWLKCTDRFAAHLEGFWKTTQGQYVKSRGAGNSLAKDVIVALIDDGVDPFDPSIDGHVLDGASFNYRHGRQQPYFVSEKGHGTVMASMIKRVCPMAKIYPIRLQTVDSEEGKSQIVVKSAVSAIRAAIEKGACIISMSWTVPVPAKNGSERKEFSDVLELAYDKNITMFCSSPDQGQFTEEDYPSAHHRERFFRIGAAREDGTVFSMAGSKEGLDFIFPGVDVVQALGTTDQYVFPDRARTFQSSTGSSVATALAAGLAATIIYCVKAGALSLATINDGSGAGGNVFSDVITPLEVETFAEQDGINTAFNRVGTVTKHKFIQVWDSFDQISKSFEDGSKSDKERARGIIDLALKLVK